MLNFTLNILCAYIATFLSIIILTGGDWHIILQCIISLVIYMVFCYVAIKVSHKPVVNKTHTIDIELLTIEYKFKTVPVITEKIAINSGFHKDRLDNLKYFVVDKHIPKNKTNDNNNNTCFGITPKVIVEDYNYSQCKYWMAKNGRDKQKVILATSLEGALFKLNMWSMTNKDINWSLLKMTRFSESKIGIFEYNEFKNSLIL